MYLITTINNNITIQVHIIHICEESTNGNASILIKQILVHIMISKLAISLTIKCNHNYIWLKYEQDEN